ncbi:MAG: hypothetical protein ACYDC8_02435 [Gammaproteobacteria bacterium]
MKLRLNRHRTTTFLLVAGLLLVQVALFAHQFQHQFVGDKSHCALCVMADHLGHAPTSSAAPLSAALIYVLLLLSPAVPRRARRPYVLRAARAPPACSPSSA